MSADVQLVFRGEVLAGFRLEDVQRELGRLLRADDARLKSVFSGRSMVLKRGLAAAEAQRYVSHLAAMGARVHVEPMPSPHAEPATGGWPPIAPPAEANRPAATPATAAPQAASLPAANPAKPATTAAAATAASSNGIAPQPIADAEEVVCPTCGERQSKRLLCRACATNIEMGIAAQREEEAQRLAERRSALEARRHTRRRAAPGADAGEHSAWAIGFSFSGRVGRLSSTTANVWLITAMLLLTTGFLQRPSLTHGLLMGIGALAVFFFSMRLTVLRCHDCDRHGWWALFVLVPYVGSLAGLLFAFLPGTPEDNEWGPPPPRGRWLWLGVALVVLTISSALLVRAGIRFAERYAAEQNDESAEEMVELGGNTSLGGGSGSATAGLQEAFSDYTRAPGPKAFAASSRQTYAWVGNAGSVDEAVSDALSQCEVRRTPYTPGCRVVSVNGQAVGN